MSADTTLYMKYTFTAPRKKVFEAWTMPETLSTWFAATEDHVTSVAEIDLRVGGKYRIGMKHVVKGIEHIATGVYKEIIPDERLVFSWSWEENPDEAETLVTLEFHDVGNATEMRLTHALFATRQRRDDHERGWVGCFERMTKAL